MMTGGEMDLRERARRAYERTRAQNALALGAVVATPAVMFSMGCCPTPAASILCGLGLASAVAAARYAGRGSQAALRPGLIAGVLAFVFPLACHGLMACPSGMCASPRLRWIPFAAAAAGFLGGVALRVFFKGGSRFVAGSTALLLGSLGSLVVGLYGPMWTAAGLAIGCLLPVKPLTGPPVSSMKGAL